MAAPSFDYQIVIVAIQQKKTEVQMVGTQGENCRKQVIDICVTGAEERDIDGAQSNTFLECSRRHCDNKQIRRPDWRCPTIGTGSDWNQL